MIAARSENDTGNNPHNPIYGIHAAGAEGALLALVGTESSDSGGNSTIPMTLFDPSARPTKVASPGEARGLGDTGQLVTLLSNSTVPAPAKPAINSFTIEAVLRSSLCANSAGLMIAVSSGSCVGSS